VVWVLVVDPPRAGAPREVIDEVSERLLSPYLSVFCHRSHEALIPSFSGTNQMEMDIQFAQQKLIYVNMWQ
jgi:hypothetical protein